MGKTTSSNELKPFIADVDMKFDDTWPKDNVDIWPLDNMIRDDHHFNEIMRLNSISYKFSDGFLSALKFSFSNGFVSEVY